MRCGRCGNENGEANRFCGMCGAPLVGKTAGAGQTSGQTTAASPSLTAPGPAAVPAQSVWKQEPVAAPRDATHSPSDARVSAGPGVRGPAGVGPSNTGPALTGPSILGLSTPGPYVERHGERDALRPSSNLDYLLEDEEEPPRGWGKVIMIVVALALVVGLSYLHWRQGGFEWARAGDKKPAATQQAVDAPSSADSGSAAGTVAAPDGNAPAVGTGGAPDAAASQAAPVQKDASGVASAPAQAATSPKQTSDANLPVGSAAQPAGPESGGQAAAVAADTPSVEKGKPVAAKPVLAKPVAAKPAAAKPAAAKPYDVVAEAERYLYGRGVRQECDHGMRLLKPAAEQANPKAMISMGALYSTGTCTPRDLPTAYRWFALALHKEPDNQALQDDLQELWSKMTQPERQLAIKLSQ